MGKTYSFSKQLALGQEYEGKIRDYFSRWYTITPATMDEQKSGIDFHFTRRGQTTKVEVKTDFLTAKTGNIFVETESVMEMGKKGWVWTSTADILLYYVVGSSDIYAAKPDKLREAMWGWDTSFDTKIVNNKAYHSAGKLIPTDIYAHVCEYVRRGVEL